MRTYHNASHRSQGETITLVNHSIQGDVGGQSDKVDSSVVNGANEDTKATHTLVIMRNIPHIETNVKRSFDLDKDCG
jgi:hypothetical protein